MGLRMRGKEPADLLAADIARQAEDWKARGHEPRIVTLLVKGDPASAYYAEAKRKAAERLAIRFELHEFEPDVQESALLRAIAQWNGDRTVHGIMVELPLPPHLDTSSVTAAIDPLKDVDGVTPVNKLALQSGADGIYPATPLACIRLLKHYGYELAGKHAVVIGRGETVGKPLAQLLLREQATVTVCHSRTPDLARHIRQADVLFAAAGRRGLITPDMTHSGLVIVDAGINEGDDGRITGDTAVETADAVAAMSPVPGGVGGVTTMMLFHNLMLGMERQLAHGISEADRPFEQTIGAFLTAAASSAPTPGGGGVAAVACALGAAMGAMTAKLSVGPKYREWEERMKEAARRLDTVAADCEHVAAGDADSFRHYMKALKLPNQSPEEKELRKQAIAAAAEQATKIPLELIRLCVDTLQIIDGMKEGANPNVLSDLGIGAVLAEAAAQSAWLTVHINLPAIRNSETRQRFRDMANERMEAIRSRKEAVQAMVIGRLKEDRG
ncbi:cyclodeaminase/cyclohydrolase family protein [Paenibacillus allorhizosphaerae]|uniref:Bifunctional protein FolD n=1 Tax=Paenibacillus allorhizosphaerae TaxID=2849866 RepID=A0ABM8VL34_9BACL|nr:cyclodeaminase/cyclohydrolase family protein [Paenibacillus allorhizosphaerae]CAG7647882.1 Bifunctional protein FolD protein [Paenibacillus allorhizosphaerae]